MPTKTNLKAPLKVQTLTKTEGRTQGYVDAVNKLLEKGYTYKSTGRREGEIYNPDGVWCLCVSNENNAGGEYLYARFPRSVGVMIRDQDLLEYWASIGHHTDQVAEGGFNRGMHLFTMLVNSRPTVKYVDSETVRYGDVYLKVRAAGDRNIYTMNHRDLSFSFNSVNSLTVHLHHCLDVLQINYAG